MNEARLASGTGRGNWGRRGAVLAVMVVVVAIGIGLWVRAQGASQQAPAAPSAPVVSVKTARVASGPISAALSYSGDVKSLAQVSVLPKGTGRIERLAVDVGSRVKKGDVIAELDAASLQAQVAQGRANLAAAQAKYNSLAAGPRAEQVGQARAALSAVEAKRDAVQKGATDSQRQAAQSAVDTASANLRTASAKLGLVMSPSDVQWAQAESAVNAARANMEAAGARLTDVKAGAKVADLAAAQSGVDAAKSAVEVASDRAEYAKNNNSVTALAGLGLSSAGQALEAVQSAQASYNSAVERLNLLKSMPLPADLQAAQSALDAARAAYESATRGLAQMKKGPIESDLAAAQGAVDAATAALASAESNLKQVSDGASEEDLRQVEATVEQARQALGLASSPYTQNDLDMAKATVMQAEAALQMAEIGLGESKVLAPVDGVVSERTQSLGQLVSPATPIVSILSPEVEMVLGVEEGQIGQVVEGQKAEITVAAYPGTVFPARVALIAPSADPKSRTFQVKVRPDASDGRLRQGMFAQVKILTAEKPTATLLPKDALVTKAGQASVFVLKGETVSQKPVKVGVAGAGVVEVLEGVVPGDEVVVAGQADLRDGDKVKKQ